MILDFHSSIPLRNPYVHIESGKRDPRLSSIERMAEAELGT